MLTYATIFAINLHEYNTLDQHCIESNVVLLNAVSLMASPDFT